jgi:hypothetical protein
MKAKIFSQAVSLAGLTMGLLAFPLLTPANGQTTVVKTRWDGRTAYKLSDGKTEAVIVPELSSRVMSFGSVGGSNFLWNGPKTFKSGEWANWGGEKVWPALQGDWPLFSPAWPPNPTYDGLPHKAEMLPGNRLRTIGPIMEGFGVRATREFSFDNATGEFLVTTTFEKVKGEPRKVAIWNVVQVPQPDAIYLLANPNSVYKDNSSWFGPMPKEARKLEVTDEGLLRYTPTTAGGYKFGTDALLPAVAGVKGDFALILRADKKEGDYPEGALGNGFPVTIWNSGGDDSAARYNEMEVMSPLTSMKIGDKLVQVLHWKIVPLKGVAGSAESRSLLYRALIGK